MIKNFRGSGPTTMEKAMNATEMLATIVKTAIKEAVNQAVEQEMAALRLRLETIEQKLIKQSEKLSFLSLDMRDDVINEVEKEFATRFKELISDVKISIEI
jgi:hypothetical protein